MTRNFAAAGSRLGLRPSDRTLRRCAGIFVVGVMSAIATGAVQVPNVATAIADATSPLGVWIHPAVLLFVFFETTVLLGFLIHGELVLMVSGMAASRGDASLVALVLLAWAGAVAGDVVGLRLGRAVGRPFLERHARRFQLARVDGFIARHGRKAIFLARFTGFLRSTMPFVVGSAGMTVRRLLPVSAVSALVWTSTFTVVGYVVAESFASAGQTVTQITSAAIVAAITAFALHARLARSRA